MKKIEKEITRIERITEYEATDGTVFKNEEECKKYEASAKCAIESAYKKTFKTFDGIGISTESCRFATFGCDSKLYAVKINNADELKVFNMRQGKDNDNLGADSIGKEIVIEAPDWDDYHYILGTREDIKAEFCAFIDKIKTCNIAE